MSLDSLPDLIKERHSFDTLKPQCSTSFRRSLAGDQLQGVVLEQAAAVVREWKYQQQSSGYKKGLAGSWIQPGLPGHDQEGKIGNDNRENRNKSCTRASLLKALIGSGELIYCIRSQCNNTGAATFLLPAPMQAFPHPVPATELLRVGRAGDSKHSLCRIRNGNGRRLFE